MHDAARETQLLAVCHDIIALRRANGCWRDRCKAKVPDCRTCPVGIAVASLVTMLSFAVTAKPQETNP